MSNSKAKAELPAIGELAYRTYMKAAGCPDDRPFEQACDIRARRIWEAVETAVGDRATAMFGEVLDELGVPIPKGLEKMMRALERRVK